MVEGVLGHVPLEPRQTYESDTVRVLDSTADATSQQYQKRHTFSTKPKRTGNPNRRLSDPLCNSVVPQSSEAATTATPTSRTTEEIINTADKVPGKSAFVLFYHMNSCVQYKVSTTLLLYLTLVCLYLIVFSTHLY